MGLERGRAAGDRTLVIRNMMVNEYCVFHRKAGSRDLIGGWTANGTFIISTTAGSVAHTWTNGTPTVSSTGSTTFVRAAGSGKGYEITAPADFNTRQLFFDVNTQYSAKCKLTVTFDGIVMDTREITVSGGSGVSDNRMTINYRSPAPTRFV